MIKVEIKLNYKLYKLDIEIYYNSFDNKSRFYQKFANYYTKRWKTNIQLHSSYKIRFIKLYLS